MIKKIVCFNILLLCSLTLGMQPDEEQQNTDSFISVNAPLENNDSIKIITTDKLMLSNAGRFFWFNDNAKNIERISVTYSLPKIFFGLFKEPIWKHITDTFTVHSNKDKEEKYLAIATENDIFLAKIIYNQDKYIKEIAIQKKLGSHNTPIYLVDLLYNKTQKQYILFSSSSYPSSKFWTFNKKTVKITEPTYKSFPGDMVIGCHLSNQNKPIFATINDKNTSSFSRWVKRKEKSSTGRLQLNTYKDNEINEIKEVENQDNNHTNINFKQCKTFFSSWKNKAYILIQEPTYNMLYKIDTASNKYESIAIKNLTLKNIVGIHCINEQTLLMVTKKGLALIDESIFLNTKNTVADYFEDEQNVEITASHYVNQLIIGVDHKNKKPKNELRRIDLKNFKFPIQLKVNEPTYIMGDGPTIKTDYKPEKSRLFEDQKSKLIFTIQETAWKNSTLNKELTLDAKYEFTVSNYTFRSGQDTSLLIKNLPKIHLHHIQNNNNNNNPWVQKSFNYLEKKLTDELNNKYANKNIIIFTKKEENFTYILILNAQNKKGDLYIQSKTQYTTLKKK